MKTIISFAYIIFTCCLVSCEKKTNLIESSFYFNLELEFLDNQGNSVFANNHLHPDKNDVEVFYIINGKPINFYSTPDATAHDLVSFIYYNETGKDLIRLFLNYNLVDNKSTTIVKLKGYPADTIYAEFNRGENYISLNKGTINGVTSFLNGDIVKIVK